MLEHAGQTGVFINQWNSRRAAMAVNKPVGDNARKGGVRKRSQLTSSDDKHDECSRESRSAREMYVTGRRQ
jgi:hypothetical protein